MKRFGSTIKFAAVGFIALIFIFAVFPAVNNRSLKKAQADSIDAYPGTCLGGWQNPSNAAGTPDVPPGDTSFTGDNSAVLNQAQAQIFCGSFQASDQSQTPASVTLNFSWNVIFASEASPSTNIDTSTDTDSSSWDGVLNATTTETSTPETSTDSSTDASDDTASDNPATSTSVSAPAPDQSSDADQSSTSFLKNIFNNPFAFFTPRALADSTDTTNGTDTTDTTDLTIDTSTTDSATTTDVSADTSGDFMDVSYSLDGTTWTDLGQVNTSDWQNYSVTIPVSSWSDINNLQVQLSPDITSDEPTIYLDGMWLAVDYNQSILSDLQDAASSTISAVTDLSNTVDNALADLLSPATSTPPEEPTPQDVPAAPAPPPPPQHQYSFVLQGAESIKGGDPAWAPEATSGSSASAQSDSQAAPTVSLPATNTIQVSGSCSSAYYTILIFPDAGDYENNPTLALYNVANKCVGGNFNQTISDLDLPSQLASGTYYLVVANQGTKGPWVPDPEIYPIQLSSQ